ncbi:hypothetical protein KP79_PYT03095 [Mizuhopecten yessoensis]|uniref:SGNH hydrolase-type esterase domain-containing protein n=1 Tax=Mizuhopecten yessoensis TaxID=6573 RepID=A0A210PJD1_MIZYE|nr:hypothetical protein KP79_PYT03095 [Mizuhopecten yessoensis]
MFGYSGGTVPKLRGSEKLWTDIRQWQPHIVILQVGGNDLCARDRSCEQIARDIVNFARQLRHCLGIVLVFVCDIFKRPQPRGISPNVYASRRTETNSLLRDWVPQHDRLVFWGHRRLHDSPRRLFLHDQCHLNQEGTKKNYRSIRLALTEPYMASKSKRAPRKRKAPASASQDDEVCGISTLAAVTEQITKNVTAAVLQELRRVPIVDVPVTPKGKWGDPHQLLLALRSNYKKILLCLPQHLFWCPS